MVESIARYMPTDISDNYRRNFFTVTEIFNSKMFMVLYFQAFQGSC